MPKYVRLALLTLQEYFVYRLNFVLWRFRSLVSFLTLFFFWLAVYGSETELLGYQKSQMLSYVVGVAFLKNIITGTRVADIAGHIRSGELNKILFQPFSPYRYWLSRDIVDKFLNLFFVIIEIGLVLAIFKFPFYFPHKIISVGLFVLLVFIAFWLSFYLNLAISFIAFWTEEVWATRFLIGVIFFEFFSGVYFPVDVLPTWLTRIIYLTPFPYLIYFPLKIWNEQVVGAMALKVIIICFAWLVLFYWLANRLWQKGAKNYGAYGG